VTTHYTCSDVKRFSSSYRSHDNTSNYCLILTRYGFCPQTAVDKSIANTPTPTSNVEALANDQSQQFEKQLCIGGKGVTVELSVRGLLSTAVWVPGRVVSMRRVFKKTLSTIQNWFLSESVNVLNTICKCSCT